MRRKHYKEFLKSRLILLLAVLALEGVSALALYHNQAANSVISSGFSPKIAEVLEPDDPRIYFKIGNYFFEGGNYNLTEAERAFDKTLELSGGKYKGANYQLSRVYFIEGNFFEALKSIDREIELYPDFKRSYYVRGLIHGYSGKLTEAEGDFKEFLKWKPGSWAGYNDLVWVYFRAGDFKNAEKYAKHGLTFAPRNPWLLNSLGVALLNLGKYEEAAKHLEEALIIFEQMGPEDWGKAYPGNDPGIYKIGYTKTLETIEKNLKLAEEKLKP